MARSNPNPRLFFGVAASVVLADAFTKIVAVDRLMPSRMPREVLAEGRYFHGIDSWERSLEFCIEELGEDMWLFASDWPHGDSAWPESVQQTADRPRLTESARKKILGENAMRLCPRLRG